MDGIIKERKNELRKAALLTRGEIPSPEKADMDGIICEKIASLPEWKNASLILVYASSRGEIDLGALYKSAKRDGKAIAFPRCLPGKEMEFAICEYRELSEGRFSIPEPPSAFSPIKVFPKDTLCILPCLIANVNGFRVGYGGGYYDKFLSLHPITTVAALYARFLTTDTDYKEPFDIPADILITEKETIRIEK